MRDLRAAAGVLVPVLVLNFVCAGDSGASPAAGFVPPVLAPTEGLVAAYAPFLLRRPRSGTPVDDIAIRRARDGVVRTFAFDAAGQRDEAAIATFLGGGTGRVTRVFDQAGSHDLVPVAGSVGPMIDATDPGNRRVLVFDNGGGFEGNPTADGGHYQAIGLGASGFALDLVHGVTMLASLRVGDIASIAPSPLLSLDPGTPSWLALAAGYHPPSRAAGGDDRTSLIHGSLFPLGPPLAATPNTIALTVRRDGAALEIDGAASALSRSWPPATWSTLELGTTVPGSGTGWSLGALLVSDLALSAADVARACAAIAAPPVRNRGPTIVLDGSSVEAGVGSTRLRNFARLYEDLLPGAAVFDVAVGGATMADRLAALPGTLECFGRATGPVILVNAAGANSLARGVDAAETYAEASRYVAAAHGAHPGLLVGLATIIPMRIGIALGHAAAFTAYNAMVRANHAGADFIIDRARDALMGAETTVFPTIDRRYSTDGVHPTDAGYARLAPIDVAAIGGALATR